VRETAELCDQFVVEDWYTSQREVVHGDVYVAQLGSTSDDARSFGRH
jgi:hypothetical protein